MFNVIISRALLNFNRVMFPFPDCTKCIIGSWSMCCFFCSVFFFFFNCLSVLSHIDFPSLLWHTLFTSRPHKPFKTLMQPQGSSEDGSFHICWHFVCVVVGIGYLAINWMFQHVHRDHVECFFFISEARGGELNYLGCYVGHFPKLVFVGSS